MTNTRWWAAILALATMAPAHGQTPADVNEAVAWASGLRESMRRMTDPVVRTYGIASLGALLCPVDKGAGIDLFREAVVHLNELPDQTFLDSSKVLPVASFSGLWKIVVVPAAKCDAAIPQPNDHARERRDAERRQAGNYLAQAKFTDDYNRAAQLAQAALEAGDPNQFDVSSATSFLIEFRVPAPDLADDVFQRAIAFATSGTVANIQGLVDLGNYLYVGNGLQGRSEPLLNRVTYYVSGSPFSSWAGQHEGANPDMEAAYIDIVAQTLMRQQVSSRDLVAAYAAAFQLLPRARDLQLSDAETLQQVLDQLQTQNASVTAAVAAKLSAGISNGSAQANFTRLMARIRVAMEAGRFSEARELLQSLDGAALRSQIAPVIDFFEAARALGAKDIGHASDLAGSLPGGVKRSLLHTGIVAVAANRLIAIPALHAGLKDAELLSYEQRMALLPAFGAACKTVDSDETHAVMSQLIDADNNATLAPRKTAFNARSTTPFDGSRILFDAGGFVEFVQQDQHQQSFSLKVPGVSAFSLEAFLAQSKDMDFPRLVATIEGLRNEVHLTKAYLALAAMRLKAAKSPESRQN